MVAPYTIARPDDFWAPYSAPRVPLVWPHAPPPAPPAPLGAPLGAPPSVPLNAQPAALPDPASIPPRGWLLGTRLVRRHVSMLAAPGGVGKSAFALATACSLATGRDLLDERVHHAVPAWVMNLEDPADEMDRRLAGLMRCHGISRDALHGRLFLHHGRNRRLVMAAAGSAGVTFPDQDAVLAAVQASGIGLVVVDPFIKSHELDENSNAHMDAAATAWAAVADAGACAVLLVHHTRKGAPGAGQEAGIEAARGAKSLSDAARSATLLTPMTEQEAEALGVPVAERTRHIRLDDAKANLAPRAAAARWFRLDPWPLGNGNADYPDGDTVAVCVPWSPKSVWAAHTPEALNLALDRIAAGPGRGTLYAPARRGRTGAGWVGWVLTGALGITPDQAAGMVHAWIDTGLLVPTMWRDRDKGRDRHGVTVDDSRRPNGTSRNAHASDEKDHCI